MAAHSNSSTITLARLLPDISLADASTRAVSGLSLDSRQLKSGEVFVAIKGAKVDGRDHVADAIVRGAAAVLVEQDKRWQGLDWVDGVPVVAVPDLPLQLSAIAGRFYGDPSVRMSLVGVTGTNGKTTCSLLLGQIFALLQERAAVIGTLGYGVLDSQRTETLGTQIEALQTTGLTTPDAIAMQRILADLQAQQARAVALEISSHSLQQGRVAALRVDTAIFTNLSHDHLDYHGDMDSYGRAKARLLAMEGLRFAIVNRDDTWAANLKVPATAQSLGYSLSDSNADIHLSDMELSRLGARATLHSPWGEGELNTSLLGVFNLSNLLAVIAAACVQGLPLADVLRVVPRLQAAPGRMQAITVDDQAQDISVIVDYAHTPDALENSLKALQAHNEGRLWCVFGCGGDRDKTKRPQMGRLAERYSDYVVVTNDNPRTEDPAQIAADIVRGMHNSNACLTIADRAQAIDLAVQQARAGDIVLLAGKGHEDYQIFAGQTLPFSDIQQARLALQRRLSRRKQEKPS